MDKRFISILFTHSCPLVISEAALNSFMLLVLFFFTELNSNVCLGVLIIECVCVCVST